MGNVVEDILAKSLVERERLQASQGLRRGHEGLSSELCAGVRCWGCLCEESLRKRSREGGLEELGDVHREQDVDEYCNLARAKWLLLADMLLSLRQQYIRRQNLANGN